MANNSDQYDPYIPPQGAPGAGGAATPGAAGQHKTAALQAVSSSFICPRTKATPGRWYRACADV